MKKLIILIMLIFTTSIQANDNVGYIGIQYGDFDTDDDDVNLTAGLIRLGITTPEGFGFEFRTGVGIEDDDFGPAKVEIERVAGAYALYYIPFGDALKVYPIIGWSEVTLKVSSLGQSGQEEDDDFSYGVGVEIRVIVKSGV